MQSKVVVGVDSSRLQSTLITIASNLIGFLLTPQKLSFFHTLFFFFAAAADLWNELSLCPYIHHSLLAYYISVIFILSVIFSCCHGEKRNKFDFKKFSSSYMAFELKW